MFQMTNATYRQQSALPFLLGRGGDIKIIKIYGGHAAGRTAFDLPFLMNASRAVRCYRAYHPHQVICDRNSRMRKSRMFRIYQFEAAVMKLVLFYIHCDFSIVDFLVFLVVVGNRVVEKKVFYLQGCFCSCTSSYWWNKCGSYLLLFFFFFLIDTIIINTNTKIKSSAMKL